MVNKIEDSYGSCRESNVKPMGEQAYDRANGDRARPHASLQKAGFIQYGPSESWRAREDPNLGPLPSEGSALLAEPGTHAPLSPEKSEQ